MHFHICRSNVRWSSDGGINPGQHSNYLERLCSTFHDTIVKLVNKSMGVQSLLSQNEIFVEVLQQHKMAVSRSSIFRGRTEILNTIRETLSREHQGIVVIHGVSGCGKTSVMAKSSQLVRPYPHILS